MVQKATEFVCLLSASNDQRKKTVFSISSMNKKLLLMFSILVWGFSLRF